MSVSMVATTVDCRGQRCPAPILATAKAAKTIGTSGGLLEVSADDDAFPFDIRAWCRSSGAELLELISEEGAFKARVRVKGTQPSYADTNHRPDASHSGASYSGASASHSGASYPNASHSGASHPNGAHPNASHSGASYPNASHSGASHPNGAHPNASHSGASHRRDAVPGPDTVVPESAAASNSGASSSGSSSRTLAYSDVALPKSSFRLDCRGERCPEPILRLAREARQGRSGDVIEVISDDPAFAMDVRSWCRSAGAALLSLDDEGRDVRATVRVAHTSLSLPITPSASSSLPSVLPSSGLPAAPSPSPTFSSAPTVDTVALSGIPEHQRRAMLDSAMSSRTSGGRIRIVVDDVDYSLELLQWGKEHHHRLISMDARGPLVADFDLMPRPSPTVALAATSAFPVDDRCTLLVLHNDRESLLAALLVAVGAAAQGMEVVMFFTFWGLNLLRGDEPNQAMPKEKVSWAQRMFKWMMPKGPKAQKLGKLDMAGVGRGMLGSIMKRYKLMDIPQLMDTAEEQGIRFVACTMSMQVMGITKRDLSGRKNLEYGGVAAFVDAASRSRMSLTF